MNLEFYNCPQPAQFDTKILPKQKPVFIDYEPDFGAMEKIAKEYAHYANILVIGHGGSVTSSEAFYNALRYQATKKAYFLNSIDPDYIAELKTELVPENTVVIAISKSGSDTTQLEMTSQFLGYPMVVVTMEGSSLEQIAYKLNLPVVRHPEIGGRYTAFTEVALLPALLSGIDTAGLLRGAREVYALYEKENLAWKAASVAWHLEEQGFVDVLGLIYSHYLFSVANLATQLCHESFGKEDRGQTYMFAEGSEVQHHTAQRLLGGRKNMAAWFIGLHTFQSTLATAYPVSTHSVPFRGHPLFDLNAIPLAQAQNFELHATMESAKLAKIPCIYMELNGLEPVEFGRFLAFWQVFAVYSSLLRQVDPFDQPAVEVGKQISFNKRLAYKGLL